MSTGTIIIIVIIFLIFCTWYDAKEKDLKQNEAIQKHEQSYLEAFEKKEIDKIIEIGTAFSKVADNERLEKLYKDALSLIKDNPNAKPYALVMGRAKYGKLRKDGAVTVYDESKINNDIMAAQ